MCILILKQTSSSVKPDYEYCGYQFFLISFLILSKIPIFFVVTGVF